MAGQCKHMLHLVPQWQSSIRHERLKVVMADRPDLIQSELSGLAFDALQQCFRTADIEMLMASATILPPTWRQTIYIVIDPAAGGPHSDFAIVSFTKQKGIITVRIVCIQFLFDAQNHPCPPPHSLKTWESDHCAASAETERLCRGTRVAVQACFH